MLDITKFIGAVTHVGRRWRGSNPLPHPQQHVRQRVILYNSCVRPTYGAAAAASTAATITITTAATASAGGGGGGGAGGGGRAGGGGACCGAGAGAGTSTAPSHTLRPTGAG